MTAGLVYLGVINALAFAVSGYDKFCARRGLWRVPEKHLFLLAALGGAAGLYLSMILLRHKTRHRQFTVGVPLLLALQAALVCWMALR